MFISLPFGLVSLHLPCFVTVTEIGIEKKTYDGIRHEK